MNAKLDSYKWHNFAFYDVIQQIKQGIMITDITGRILFVNTTFCETTGYGTNEIVGKTPKIFRSEMHDPIFYKHIWQSLYETGYWQGEIYNRNKKGEIYLQWLEINVMKNDHEEITRFVAIYTDIQKHKKARDEITFLAYHDPLTKLPNRLYAKQYLDDLLKKVKEQQLIAVLYLDLDRFKQINDTLGHSYGDEVLQQAAIRIEDCLRKGDVVSRMGGDEFLCILPGITLEEDAEKIAQKLINALAKPFYFKDIECYLTASIGISFYPYDGEDIETLITYADSAMYRAKNSGKNQYKLAKAEANAGAFERLLVENGLRKGIEEDAFTLHYQPQIDLETYKATGFEALLRWEHPELGIVSPADFIPIAEETGLIIPIGEWVLRTACTQNMKWQQAGYPPTRIAVNITAQQLLATNFTDIVFNILKETEMPARLLELEITETTLIQHASITLPILQKLRDCGIRVSIDDFGTGYSSLHYLKNFPLDTLKIDRSFIRDLDSSSHSEIITSSIISLGHQLNMKVVAEGVETNTQLSKLVIPKCDEIQGFLFSKPIPSNRVAEWLENYRLKDSVTI